MGSHLLEVPTTITMPPQFELSAHARRQRDILSTIAHPRLSLDSIMINAETLRVRCPMDNDRTMALTSSVSENLGNLEYLPLEIIELILLTADLASLTAFRAVNSRALNVVDELHPYQTLVSYARPTLRAFLATGTAAYFSTMEIFSTFNTHKCSRPTCKTDFAAFLFLPSCVRVCLLCATSSPEFLPISSRAAKRQYGLNTKALASLPKTRIIPGEYSFKQTQSKRRQNLLSSILAKEAGKACGGKPVWREERWDESGSATAVSAPENDDSFNPSTVIYTSTFSETYFHIDKRAYDVRRFMGLVRFPAQVKRGRDGVEWGLACEGCAKELEKKAPNDMGWEDKFRKANMMYTQVTFLKHFWEDCEPARKLWVEAGGTLGPL